jgi:hypothetical protein
MTITNTTGTTQTPGLKAIQTAGTAHNTNKVQYLKFLSNLGLEGMATAHTSGTYFVDNNNTNNANTTRTIVLAMHHALRQYSNQPITQRQTPANRLTLASIVDILTATVVADFGHEKDSLNHFTTQVVSQIQNKEHAAEFDAVKQVLDRYIKNPSVRNNPAKEDLSISNAISQHAPELFDNYYALVLVSQLESRIRSNRGNTSEENNSQRQLQKLLDPNNSTLLVNEQIQRYCQQVLAKQGAERYKKAPTTHLML